MSPTQAVYFFPNPTESLRVVPEHRLNPTFILVFMSGGDRPTRRVPAGTCRVATLERLPSIDSSQSQINLTHPPPSGQGCKLQSVYMTDGVFCHG